MDLGIIGGADGPTAVMVAAAAAGNMIFTLLLFAAGLLVQFFVAREFRRIAMMKGHHERRYFWIPFFLGIAGWIMVASLPDRSIITQNDQNFK
ncbi:MAG: hypothetical protein E7632_07745 [Ruminococcaceae bacterium]|nr:hypothetical protein [Oscillospiraceae bacterium]